MITTVTYNPNEPFAVTHNRQNNERSLNHSHPSEKTILPKLKTMEIHQLISLTTVYEFEIEQFESVLRNTSISDKARIGIYTAYKQDKKILKIIKAVYKQRVGEYLAEGFEKTSKKKKCEKPEEPQKEKNRAEVPENAYGTYFSNAEVRTPYTITDTRYVTTIDDV